jgi:hypothetical protein
MRVKIMNNSFTCVPKLEMDLFSIDCSSLPIHSMSQIEFTVVCTNRIDFIAHLLRFFRD